MDLKYESLGDMGKRISVHIGTAIKLELQDIELPLQSSVVGLENDKYIIIKAPEPFARIQHKLYPGNELIVRYISDGTVFAFQTKLIATITTPIPLLFIEYPKIIQHHDLRVQKRVSCQIPARIIVQDQENVGCIMDMARSGCRCIVQNKKNPSLIRFDLEKRVIIKCIFPGNKELISLPGIVKNVKRTRQEYDLGIFFKGDMSLDCHKTIAWFISTIDNLT